MKNLLSIVFLCCTYVSSVIRSSWHFSTSGFNIRFLRTPKNWKEVNNKFSSDYFHILHVVGRIALEWNLFQNFDGALKQAYIHKMFMSSTHLYWFRATGGYICGYGRPSNLVILVYIILVLDILHILWVVYQGEIIDDVIYVVSQKY